MKITTPGSGSEPMAPGAAPSSQDGWLKPRTFLLILATVLVVVFWKALVGIDTFFYRDFGALGYPIDFYQHESLAHGHLPLWDPYSHCGVPFLAQWGRWYPISFVGQVLPPAWFANLFVVLHLFWGGAGVYWLCRRWQIGPLGAMFAAIAFTFNGVTMSCLQWSNYIACLSWLPWVVGCVTIAWLNGGRWIVWAALAAAMQVLTATPELTVLTWLLLGVLWLGSLWSREAKFFSSARRLAALVCLAAGLTMVQMLPFFDLLAHSQRSTGTNMATWAVPSWGWANLFVPLFHCFLSPQGSWFQNGQEFLQSYYLGAGVLVLAVAGTVWNRSRRNAILVGMALFCWLMSMGPHTIFFEWFRRCFPLVGIARYPVKFAILPAFLIPLLAAQAVEKIRENSQGEKNRRRLLIISIGIMLLLMAGLLWWMRRSPLEYDRWNDTATNALWRAILMGGVLGGLLLSAKVSAPKIRIALQLFALALIPLDALTHSPNIAPTAPMSILAPGLWEAKGNSPIPLASGRAMIHPEAEQKLGASEFGNFQVDFLVRRISEWYNLNLLDKVPKVTGAFTLRPADFDKIEQYLYYTPGAHCGRGLLDFMSVTWLSSPENSTDWQPRTNALALMTGGQRPIFVPENQLLAAITSDQFDPRTEVYFPESARSLVTVSNQAKCTIHDVRFGSDTIESSVQADAPALIVLSESYYHLWRAFVDDQPVDLLRANLAFQAVQVPAGTHRLKLVYTDSNIRWGAILSALSVVICILVWLKTKPAR